MAKTAQKGYYGEAGEGIGGMIREININNYSSLRNFTNKHCKFSNENSVIHGLNGSGKSQICSVFNQIKKLKTIKSLEQKQQEKEKSDILKYIGARLSKESISTIIDIKIDEYNLLIDTSKNTITETGIAPDVFVFNEDYINENIGESLNFQDQEIRIGQKNIIRDNFLKEKQEKEKDLLNINENIEKTINKAKADLGIVYSKQKRTNDLINRTNYLSATNPCEAHPEAKAQLEKLSNPPEPITIHQKYSFPLLDIDNSIKSEIIELLFKEYIEPKITQEFYKTFLSVKKSFYEEGAALFKEVKNRCPFCLSSKSEDDPIINELINYLFSNYNSALNYLQKTINMFNDKINEIEIFIANWNKLVPMINEKLKTLSMDIEIQELSIEKNIIEQYIKSLTTKAENMSKSQTPDNYFELYDNFVSEIKSQYLKHLDIINKVNTEIEKISSRKKSIGDNIIENQMYLLWQKSNLRERYNTTISEIETLKMEIEKTSLTTSNNNIPSFFNQIIKILGITKYELNSESILYLRLEKDFNINNEGYRISDGERKFIALSYFFAEVLASAGSNAELSQKTIIIDDPVDSSDYERFYSFISVIENFNKILINIFRNNEIKFGQIFIFTHNALLFERLSKNLSHYLLSVENHCTIINKANTKTSLTTFSSYIKKVTDYIKKMEPNNIRNIGNYIRRLLEIISSVENINNNKITIKNASSKLNSLVNHLSHESIERVLDPLPVSCEYIEACIEVIEEIENRMPVLYDSIKEGYLDGNDISHYRTEYMKKFILHDKELPNA